MEKFKMLSVQQNDMVDAEKAASKADGKSLTVTSSTPSSSQHTAEAERRVVRKIDLQLMNLVFVLYMFALLDRSNIGNARIAGMGRDLSLDGYRYDWLLTIFYISYVLSEFLVLFWKRFPPHKVGAIAVLGWGIIATVQAGTSSWGGMMALRFLLGVFEALYGPGIVYLLTFFYLRHEIGLRIGIFISAAPLATTFAGALAYGITSGHSKLANWRLLFLVEGLPTLVMGVVTYFFLPDSPEKTRLLTEDERAIVRSRVHRQVGSSASERIGRVSWKDVLLVAVDLKAWINSLMYFCGNVTFSSLSVFLPTILEDMGYTAINAQGLSAPPSFAAFIFALLTTWIADKTRQRCLVVFTTGITGGIGYVILATVERVGVRYFATFLASAGVFSTIANINAIQLNNQGSDTRRGTALVLLQMVGQCGPFLGTQIFPTSQAPRYIKGMSICAGFMFFSALLALGQRCLLSWENVKLDRKYGRREVVSADGAVEADKEVQEEQAGVENYGPNFRYCL